MGSIRKGTHRDVSRKPAHRFDELGMKDKHELVKSKGSGWEAMGSESEAEAWE